MPKTATMEPKVTRPTIGDLVLVGGSLYLFESESSDTRAGVTTTSYHCALIGPPHANSSIGRVGRTVTADQITAIFRAAS